MKNLVFGVNQVKYPQKGKKPGLDLGLVAIWNEYGTRLAPPRPAFRMGLESSIKKNEKLIQAQLKNITQRILTGRSAEIDKSLTVLLTQIGRTAKKETQDIIKMGSTTANAPSTVKRKGFNHPLVETELLLKNVAYEVTE